MENNIKEFSDYRLKKRQEITSMQSIITDLNTELRESDRNLLISSYIVLTYAYWESCFHKFQSLLFIWYQKKKIKDLPYELQNKVYLELSKQAAASNKNKTISEIKSSNVFDKIYDTIHSSKEKNLQELDLIKKTKYIFINTTENPKMSHIEELMKNNHNNLSKFLSSLKQDGILNCYFEQGIQFIIDQRNAIAHKNEGIIYKKKAYKNFDKCYEELKKDCSRNLNNDCIENFIQDMSYQIDIFYNKLVEKLIVMESS